MQQVQQAPGAEIAVQDSFTQVLHQPPGLAHSYQYTHGAHSEVPMVSHPLHSAPGAAYAAPSYYDPSG